MTHTLLVVSGKRALPAGLLADPHIGTLSVVTESGGIPGRFEAAERVETVPDISDNAAVFAAAARINDGRLVDHVLAPFETGLPAAAYVRTLLGIPGLDFRTAVAFSNKYVMKQISQRAGLPVTPHRLAVGLDGCASAAEELRYPVVLKPPYGGGSVGVAVCEGPADVVSWWQRHGVATGGLAVVERKVEMLEEFHVDSLVVDTDVRFAVVSRYLEPMLDSTRRREPYASYQLPSSHGPSDELLDLSARTILALGLRSGVTHLEVFRTGDGWCVSEIACRAGGGGVADAIAANHGVDLFAASVALDLGRVPDLPADAVATTDVFFGHTALATRPGVVTRVSTPDTFRGVPELVGVRMSLAPADVVPHAFLSASSAGFVQVRSCSESDVVDALREVQRRHVIETRDEGALVTHE